MVCKVSIILLILFLSSVQGCLYFYSSGRKKRSLTEEATKTEKMREYFSDCMNHQITTETWESQIDFTVLESDWYQETEDFSCFGDATAECWKGELDNFAQSDDDTKKVVKAGKYCIAEFEKAWISGNHDYPQKKRKKRQSDLSDRSFRDVPGFAELSAYSSCLGDPWIRVRRRPTNYKAVASFVSKHLQYSCDSRRSQDYRNGSPAWPFRFLALTRADSLLRERLKDCGKRYYAPRPFWSGYSGWSNCSSSCGPYGTQTRTRSCRSGAYPVNRATGCYGSSIERRSCTGTRCSQRYYWGKWSTWTNCKPISSRCLFGRGRQSRSRRCFSGKRKVASRLCDGNDTESRSCFTACG